MIQSSAQDNLRPLPAIEAVIAAHGAWKVLIAAAVALWRGRMRKARPPDRLPLDNRIRADIGLPPVAPAPEWAVHWAASLMPR